ncbi:MAG: hypothetical protein K2X74_07270, partial [Acetobacteraceae bacterium]|nr:hypothetical protein [Acetobacteraceae bacterium]
MNLTAEQVAAAEAAGCSFIPAPTGAIHRYAMQRKLFRLDGREMLATRGGGLFETSATLEPLILEGRARLTARAPRVEALAAPAGQAPSPAEAAESVRLPMEASKVPPECAPVVAAVALPECAPVVAAVALPECALVVAAAVPPEHARAAAEAARPESAPLVAEVARPES